MASSIPTQNTKNDHDNNNYHTVHVTGTRLQDGWPPYLQFLYHAVPCVAVAHTLPGIVSMQTRQVQGSRYTLSVWETPPQLRQFQASPWYQSAQKILPHVAESHQECMYETTPGKMASWDEALRQLEQCGQTVEYHHHDNNNNNNKANPK